MPCAQPGQSHGGSSAQELAHARIPSWAAQPCRETSIATCTLHSVAQSCAQCILHSTEYIHVFVRVATQLHGCHAHGMTAVISAHAAFHNMRTCICTWSNTIARMPHAWHDCCHLCACSHLRAASCMRAALCSCVSPTRAIEGCSSAPHRHTCSMRTNECAITLLIEMTCAPCGPPHCHF